MTDIRKLILTEIKEGKLRKLLGVPNSKNIEDVYKSGKQIASVLMKKVKYEDALRMLVFASNMNPENRLFKSAVRSLKSNFSED